ncbi:unnamed protein product [Pseudo-nitzschia multistriata]|uniref:Protein kinase domain-containing protein n=1 Tax=Pseudo-nitzschia multistriata TaxID=183589 RepID=A0A448ZQW3_9STRA|nr:unnamed protein product [Pseudo-nitzschia multistriata]
MDPSVLSLVENSIAFVPLEGKDEWDVLVASPTTTTSPRKPPNGPGGSSPSHAVVYPTAGGLRKACLAEVARSPGQRRKATLVAALEKWILQNQKAVSRPKAKRAGAGGAPPQEPPKSSPVRLLAIGGPGGQDPHPEAVLDRYAEAVAAGSSGEPPGGSGGPPDGKQPPPAPLGCALARGPMDPSGSLVLRCHRTLVDGTVGRGTPKTRHRTGPRVLRPTGDNDKKKDHDDAVLRCASALYHRIWCVRTLRKRDLRRAYGFALEAAPAAASHGSGDAAVALSVTLMMLEKPSWSAAKTERTFETPRRPASRIGGRYPLYLYTRHYHLPKASGSGPCSPESVLGDLAAFLYVSSAVLPCPCRDTPPLREAWRSSPGCMLLPDQGPGASPSSVLPGTGGAGGRFSVAPTITGSLVVRCEGAEAVGELLRSLRPGSLPAYGREETEETERMRALAAAVASAAEEGGDGVWYAKYKTPALGAFWDLSRSAINGPRGGLLGRRTRSLPACARDWLWLHPVDSSVGPRCSVTVTRSAGLPLRGSLGKTVPWREFLRLFRGLAESVLGVQSASGGLVHGDVHEGNLLYLGGAKHAAERAPRLVLIDWDEATRGKPCHRATRTDEERLRYPGCLVDFPEQYTKQQLLCLFRALASAYYPSEAEGWDDRFPLTGPDRGGTSGGSPPGRAAVEDRFRALLRGLASGQ